MAKEESWDVPILSTQERDHVRRCFIRYHGNPLVGWMYTYDWEAGVWTHKEREYLYPMDIIERYEIPSNVYWRWVKWYLETQAGGIG